MGLLLVVFLHLFPESPPGVEADWQERGGRNQIDLRLRGLPAHQRLLISFVPMDSDETNFGYSDGARWSFVEFANCATGERTSCEIPHDGSMLRLRWFGPVEDVRVEATSEWKSVDVSRTRPRPGSRRAIIFGGTRGVPSHGFLIFEHEDPRSRQTRVRGFGFYPDAATSFARLVLLRQVPGFVADELLNRKFSHVEEQIVVYVDERQYRAAEAVIGRWQCQGEYRLLLKDCVTLMRDVAAAIGLNAPRRGISGARPADYVRKLIDAN